jgi:signal transduction histidine kinase/CheY-like chemotaxis protein
MIGKVLVISDSPTQRMMWQVNLESTGYQVLTAGDGLSGLNYIFRELPDVVLTDVVLPNLSGYQLCRLAKSDPHTRNIGMILLTSLDQKVDSFWGLEAGADLYLNKQSDPQPVLKAVSELLESGKTAKIDGHRSDMTKMFTPLLSDSDAQGRLAKLLDSLLFKTTIRGAVRTLARDTIDRMSLHSKVFDLLRRMFEHTLAVLAVQSKKGVRIAFDPQIPMTSSDIHAICDRIQDGLPKRGSEWQKLDISVMNPDAIDETVSSLEIKSEVAVSFEIDEDLRGSIILYSTQDNAYDSEVQGILEIIADELSLVLRSLSRHDEIETLKTDFTAMLVHDLRSPLTAIIGFAELMLQAQAQEPLSQWHQERVDRIASSGRRLLTLVNDILDLSKLESGHSNMVFTPVDMSALMDRVEKDMAVLAKNANVELLTQVADNLPPMEADDHQMTRVLTNLISNAIKFSPEKGIVRIEVEHIAEKDQTETGHIRICIEDSGTGIPEEKINQIFSKYERAHGQNYSGTGLGLAICKEIVEAHHGRIWLESKPGTGTIVSLLLPLSQSGPEAHKSNSKETPLPESKPEHPDKVLA